ncbi:hypothetical protein HAX54_043569 [Datura stramonium]|uniref:Uncharacterized protein n=1 Tax=Datura stramonium TaxID=4076 RepID=A0ABS8W3W5_DATST|nr:hypothetical protein [Datura stramonium]
MDVDGLNKIVVAIDVDMQSGRCEIGPQGSRDVYKFQLTNLYETLVNDSDNNEDSEGGFYLQVDGIQESSVGVGKKRRVDVDTETSVNGSKPSKNCNLDNSPPIPF